MARDATLVVVLFVLAVGLPAVFFAGLNRAEAESPLRTSVEMLDPLPGFALLELFTSEGCSSCPPADDVLADLDAEARDAKEPVFALSYHVDYWDGLGWPDRFADARFTQRQRDYARAFRSNRIYTPQLIVNGTTEFVGSRRDLAEQTIAEARSIAAQAELTIALEPVDLHENKVSVRVSIEVDTIGVTALPRDAVLHVALTQREAVTRVKRGENARRTLRHVNVVREFRALPWSAELEQDGAALTFALPDEPQGTAFEVVAFVQDGPTGLVLAAQRAAVSLNES